MKRSGTRCVYHASGTRCVYHTSCVSRIEGANNNLPKLALNCLPSAQDVFSFLSGGIYKTLMYFSIPHGSPTVCFALAPGSCSQPDYGSISLYRHRMPLPFLRQVFATKPRPSPVLSHQTRSQARGLFPRKRVRWRWGLWMRV